MKWVTRKPSLGVGRFSKSMAGVCSFTVLCSSHRKCSATRSGAPSVDDVDELQLLERPLYGDLLDLSDAADVVLVVHDGGLERRRLLSLEGVLERPVRHGHR